MVSDGRAREREQKKRQRSIEASLKRNPASVKPKKRVCIVMEGAVTERKYFDHFRQKYRQTVAVYLEKKTGVPKTLVELALKAKLASDDEGREAGVPAYDQVWVVFDRDDHVEFEESIEAATAGGIRAAPSNPCFELWALLHFQDQRAELTRKAAAKLMKQHQPGYEKELDLELLLPGHEAACNRAAALAKAAAEAGSHFGNPSTYVHRLVAELVST